VEPGLKGTNLRRVATTNAEVKPGVTAAQRATRRRVISSRGHTTDLQNRIVIGRRLAVAATYKLT
jgi:hypothetical protein